MNIGKLTYVNGDATEPQKEKDDEIVVIAHCCNNGTDERGIGVMGAGVALALRKKWPQVYEVYKRMESESENGLSQRLGENSYAKINNYLVIVNMIAQNGVVSHSNPCPVKYVSLMQCMIKVVDYINMIKSQISNPIVIHAPKFGCGLAQGNWDFIETLIKEIWLGNGIDVKIYEFN